MNRSTKSAPDLEEARWAAQRRSEPCNDLLRPTVRWMLRLPEEVRPISLCRDFPRIGNLLAASWAEVDATFAYLDDLLHDRRGNRKGFPPDVRSELIVLYVHYVREHPSTEATEENLGAPGTPGFPYPFEPVEERPSASVTPLPAKAAAQATKAVAKPVAAAAPAAAPRKSVAG